MPLIPTLFKANGIVFSASLMSSPRTTLHLGFFTHKMGNWLLRDFEGIVFTHQAVPPCLFFAMNNSSFLLLLLCNSAFSFSPPIPQPQIGTLFASIALLETLGGVTAVSAFNGIYSATVAWYPGFTFLLSAGLLLIPVISLWYVLSFNHFVKG